ncbi:MAG: hypothetical protein ACREVN_10385 [Gammaproteobacteria bacterium]
MLAGMTGTAATAIAAEPFESNLGEAANAYAAGDYLGSVARLEEALAAARHKAPLDIRNFYSVEEKADYYGHFEPRTDNVYTANPTLFYYLEPKNLVFARSEDTYTGGFSIDVAIRNDANEVVLAQEDFITFEFASRNLINDVFTNITLNLTGAPAGNYAMEFTVHDLGSDKSAAVKDEIRIQ